MDKTQEEKFEKFYSNAFDGHVVIDVLARPIARRFFEKGIEASAIIDTTESSAPEWVIDMMRTGKPVRCRVWDDEEYGAKIITMRQMVEDGLLKSSE